MFATCISGYLKTVGCKQLKHGAIPCRFKLLYQTSVVHLPCEGPAVQAMTVQLFHLQMSSIVNIAHACLLLLLTMVS